MQAILDQLMSSGGSKNGQKSLTNVNPLHKIFQNLCFGWFKILIFMFIFARNVELLAYSLCFQCIYHIGALHSLKKLVDVLSKSTSFCFCLNSCSNLKWENLWPFGLYKNKNKKNVDDNRRQGKLVCVGLFFLMNKCKVVWEQNLTFDKQNDQFL